MANALATEAAASSAGPEPSLIGTWRVTSAHVRTEGAQDQGVRQKVGYLVFTPEHRLVALVADPGRKPARNDDEALSLSRSLVVYTGKFDLTPDHYTVHVEFSSTQLQLDTPQTRYYKIDGDRLTIDSPPKDSMIGAGLRTSTVLTAVRER